MAPIVKEPEVSAPAQPNLESNPLGAGKPQAAAAEISVTVNGARTAAGSNKREPFSESTSTVLVYPKGAVIRLSSTVVTGQLLFLTNEKTKKEVVCQVVKAKSEGGASGYVELQFTEPAAGFWGMRFPGSSPATALPVETKPLAPVAPSALPPLAPVQTSALPPVVPVSASTLPPLEEKLAEVITRRVTAGKEVAKISEPQSPRLAAETSPSKSESGSVEKTQPSAPALPTLSQFLSHGEDGPELRVSEKNKPATNGDKPSVNGDKAAIAQESSFGTEEQRKPLSTHLLEPQPAKPKEFTPSAQPTVVEKPAKAGEQFEPKATLSKLLLAPPAAPNPAPGTSTFDFGADEVKIPAWLEPLARNSAVSAPAPETKSREAYEPPAKSVEDWTGGDKASEALLGSSESAKTTALEEVAADETAIAGESESGLSSEGPTPNFGLSLALDKKSEQSAAAGKGSSKGLIFGLLAAGLLLAAGGGWYWYSNQATEAGSGAAAKLEEVQPAVAPAASAAPTSESVRPVTTPKAPAAVNTLPARTENKVTGNSLNSSKPSAGDVDSSSLGAAKPAVIEPDTKPSLGKVHLAAPVLSHHADSSNTISDSAPALNGSVSGVDTSNLSDLSSKSGQPAAPIPVGGDVKPARLLSSVAPVYPQLARNQRLGGDVKLDALIDASGHVSATKVLSGPALLHQAAMDAVRQWKYQPATLNGASVPMHLTVTVQFKAQ